jgi:hypothetical protein
MRKPASWSDKWEKFLPTLAADADHFKYLAHRLEMSITEVLLMEIAQRIVQQHEAWKTGIKMELPQNPKEPWEDD